MTRKFRINAFEPIDKLRGKTIIGFPSNAKKKKVSALESDSLT